MPYSNITLDREEALAADDRGALSQAPVASDAGDAGREAHRLAQEIVARFVRDPSAFAATARAEDPQAFLHEDRQSVV